MSKIDNYSKKELVKFIKNSNSFKEVVEKIGYNSNGSGGYYMVKKKLIELNIDIPKYKRKNSSNNFSNKKPLIEVLVENSSYSRSSLKKRLIKEGIFEYKCNRCGIDEWLGNKISLQLDHINGINNDNRINNLEFLCPNCHSQTPTYGGKNIGKTIHGTIESKPLNKCKCGKIINPRSTKCIKCNNLSQRTIKRPSCEDLINDLNNNTWVNVGKKYNVSDNTIRKWVKKYENEGFDVSISNKRGTLIKKICEVCNNSFNTYKINQKKCSKECSNIFNRKVNRPSKNEFNELMKNNNISEISRMFNVTPNAIKRWVKYYNKQ